MQVHPLFAPPPSGASRFRSDDLDEIREFIARFDGDHRRTARGGGPLGYEVAAVGAGAVDLGWGGVSRHQQVTGIPRGWIVHLPTRRKHVYRVGRTTLESGPRVAMMLPPGVAYTLYAEPDDCTLVLRVPAGAVERELLRRDASAAARGARVQEIPLNSQQLVELAGLQRALAAGASPPGEASGPAGASHLEARLCGWMSDQVLGTRSASVRPGLGIERVRAVEEWIEAHLAEPITLGRLCSVAGVGDRWLESAFRTHRGQTPMQFLAARRLAWVRRTLLDARPGTTVAGVAYSAGFTHLGRFALRYRDAYGESPSATLYSRVRRD